MSKKVMVVDDEEDVRLFLEDFLNDRELNVITAANGKEAVEKVRAERPDVVLLDIMMPGMDGLEALEHIKKEFPATVCIMITALKDETRIARAQQLGARNYIVKPFSLNYLETELLKLIQ